MSSKLREAFEALLRCTPYSSLRFGKTTTARAIDALRAAIEEAEREAQALRADKARLDWLEAHCRNLYYSSLNGQDWWSIGWGDWSPALRQTIDIARASGASVQPKPMAGDMCTVCGEVITSWPHELRCKGRASGKGES